MEGRVSARRIGVVTVLLIVCMLGVQPRAHANELLGGVAELVLNRRLDLLWRELVGKVDLSNAGDIDDLRHYGEYV